MKESVTLLSGAFLVVKQAKFAKITSFVQKKRSSSIGCCIFVEFPLIMNLPSVMRIHIGRNQTNPIFYNEEEKPNETISIQCVHMSILWKKN